MAGRHPKAHANHVTPQALRHLVHPQPCDLRPKSTGSVFVPGFVVGSLLNIVHTFASLYSLSIHRLKRNS